MSTLSEVGICNVSLAYLGADSIKSFDENNIRSRMCKNMYDVVRDSALTCYDWSFARKTAKIQELTETHVKGTVFQMPNDCMTPIRLWPRASQRYEWFIEGKKIIIPDTFVTLDDDGDSEVYLEYTSMVVDTALFTSSFTEVIQLDIASRIAPAITQDLKLADALESRLVIKRERAQAEDAERASEYRYPDEDPENDTFVNPDLVTTTCP